MTIGQISRPNEAKRDDRSPGYQSRGLARQYGLIRLSIILADWIAFTRTAPFFKSIIFNMWSGWTRSNTNLVYVL
jgi:hypothetical protein